MVERPILFSAPMVRAILERRKSQTRRMVKPGPPPCQTDADAMFPYRHGWRYSGVDYACERDLELCPYGKIGDRLWVREAWKTAKMNDHLSPADMIKACRDAGWKSGRAWAPIEYLADGHRENWDTFPRDNGRYRHARFMPRDYSRITLEITDVRVQRVQEISEEDAQAEGPAMGYDGPYSFHQGFNFRGGFMALWESINGPGSWKANSWVWAVTFVKLSPPPYDGRR